MIDTLDILHEFLSISDYDTCFAVIDTLSREKNGQAVHKTTYKNRYVTTAFADIGFMMITFYKQPLYRNYRLCITLKPIRLLHFNSQLLLANFNDYDEICYRINHFFHIINNKCSTNLLPPIHLWHVIRIDYAMNFFTPHVNIYIKLFYAGFIPKGFQIKNLYENSFYLSSKNIRINFYDKLFQVQSKFDYSKNNIYQELKYIPDGILRLEVQCGDKYIHHIKSKYALPDTTLPYLWDYNIAEREIKYRIASVIDVDDFLIYDLCVTSLQKSYSVRMSNRCLLMMRRMCLNRNLSLNKIYNAITRTNDFHQIIHKFHKLGINPIPLDIALNDSVSNLTKLDNPYKHICF